MKRIMKITALALLVVLGSTWGNNVSAQADDNDYYEEDYRDDDYGEGYRDGYRDGEVSYQTFYDELSPHGRWVDYPGYGYVWIPNAGPSFRPYSTNGHWVWTNDYEWMWVSDYRWGWATFHYGRWFYDPFYGWVWVPGYEWSPAWVAWRHGGDYYGWAPLRPGIHISIGFSIGSYSPPYDYWCFAPSRYIASRNIHNYYIDRSRNVTIINQTTIINNYNYSQNVFRTGPRRAEAERYAGRITPVRFRESSRPGRSTLRNNEVSVYRPSVRREENRRNAPRSFERYDRRGAANENGITRNSNEQRNRGNRIERGNDNRVDRSNPARGRMDRRVEANGNGRRENGNEIRERGNSPVERRNNDVRQQQENRNNEAIERRRQMAEQRNRTMENGRQQNQNGNRQFDRPNIERNNQPQVREQRREMRTENRPSQMERNNQPQVREQRREMRMENRPAPMERNNQPQVREQRREMRMESRPAPQVERRQPQAQPQQPRIEQREASSGQGGGNGGGNGRGRRGRD